MQVTIEAAEASLAELIDAVLNGGEVIIARGDKPVVKLVAIATRGKFVFDVLAHKIAGPIPDFLEPMSEEELALWEGDGERL